MNGLSMEPVHIVIIAEAGVNHNGSVENALRLVDAAAEAGADYVKFQTFKAEKLVTAEARKADYAQRNTGEGDRQMDMLRSLELNKNEHQQLIEHCKKQGVQFLSTGFDEEALEMLVAMGVDRIKIPSGELTNLPYLRKAASFGLPVILSTGMASLEEVRESKEALEVAGLHPDAITVLHCTTEYPAPLGEVNLRAMQIMGRELGVAAGYSDHTMGIEVSIAAAALGATIIEKHFTLDRSMEGPDHKASLEPDELKLMVRSIRNIENALGDGVKRLQTSEARNLAVTRKSIHQNRAVSAGECLSQDMLVMLRPGDGISPMEIDDLIGKRFKRDLPMHHKLSWNDLE